MSVGIGGFQKVDLRSPRPGVPRGSGIAFHREGTGERARVAVLMSTTPDEPESQALQSGTSLNSFSLVRVVMGQSSGGACSPLMRRGVFSVNFALWGLQERSSLICATTVCTVCEHAQPKLANNSGAPSLLLARRLSIIWAKKGGKGVEPVW